MNSLIRNENHIKNVIDFTGLQNKKMHPSDIDSVMEFNDKFLILMEFKKDNAEIPLGQKLLLERICNAWNKSGYDKKAVILKVTHSCSGTILAKDCRVVKIYQDSKWIDMKMNLKKCLMKLGKKWNCEKLNLE